MSDRSTVVSERDGGDVLLLLVFVALSIAFFGGCMVILL